MIRKFIVVCVLILFVSSSAFAANEPKVWRVTGMGVPPSNWDQHDSFAKTFARQAARMDALRQLAEIVNGVHIERDDEKDYFKTWVLHDSKVFKLLEKNARQVGKARFEDGVCYVDMEVVVPADWKN